jgi:hypothetical protein
MPPRLLKPTKRDTRPGNGSGSAAPIHEETGHDQDEYTEPDDVEHRLWLVIVLGLLGVSHVGPGMDHGVGDHVVEEDETNHNNKRYRCCQPQTRPHIARCVCHIQGFHRISRSFEVGEPR